MSVRHGLSKSLGSRSSLFEKDNIRRHYTIHRLPTSSGLRLLIERLPCYKKKGSVKAMTKVELPESKRAAKSFLRSAHPVTNESIILFLSKEARLKNKSIGT